jgi:hypothetical protein
MGRGAFLLPGYLVAAIEAGRDALPFAPLASDRAFPPLASEA